MLTSPLRSLLDRNSLPFCTKIMQLAPALAQNHFAAKLVDKCLKPHKAGPAGIAAFVEAVVSSSGCVEPSTYVTEDLLDSS